MGLRPTAVRQHPHAARRPLPPVPLVGGVPAAGLQQAWEDLGVTVLQGYGATETGTGTCTTLEDHGPGTVGRPPEGIEMRLAPDGEIQFRGRTVFGGYWNAPEATAAAFTEDGWYRTGDIGHLDDDGRLILSGRTKDIIVLPNGFNVYPEDIENALRIAGIRDSVVARDAAGPDRGRRPRRDRRCRRGAIAPHAARPSSAPASTRRSRPRTRPLARTSGSPAGASGREEDFPRTHTLKIKRDPVRAWVAADHAPRRSRTSRLSRRPGRGSPSVSSAAWMSGARRDRSRRRAASRRRSTVVPTPRMTWTVPSGDWTRPGPVAR